MGKVRTGVNDGGKGNARNTALLDAEGCFLNTPKCTPNQNTPRLGGVGECFSYNLAVVLG